jgi:hypothetical protein
MTTWRRNVIDRRSFWPGPALAGLVLGLVGWSLYRQGMDLGGDGAWLLGADRLLHGARLYRDLDPGDGPLRYWVLSPFLALRHDFSALTLLRSLALALTGALGLAWARTHGVGRWRWAWPVLLLALGPLDLPGAMLLGGVLVLVSHRREAAAALGALCVLSLGLDPRVAVAMGILAAGAHFARTPQERDGAGRFALGAAGAAAFLLLTGVLGGSLDSMLRNTFVHPWWRLQQHFLEGGALHWWHTLLRGERVQSALAFLSTGESLQSFGTWQEFLHRWAWRGLALLSVLGGGFLAVLLRNVRRGLALGLSLSAVAVWLLVADGDVAAMALAALLVFAGAVISLGMRPGSIAARLAVLAFCVVALPLGAERLWLATRIDRPELARYDRAGVDVARERGHRLQEFFDRIQPALTRPVVVWPDQAGLYFLYDALPAVPQLGLTGLDLAPGTRSESLIRSDPEVVILAQNWNTPAQRLRAEDPPLWSTLRNRYRVAGWLRGRTDRLRLLVRMKETESRETLPLERQLPLVELSVSNDVSPALRKNLTVGQSFTTGDEDLTGVMFKWKTTGKNLKFDVKVRVWQKRGAEFDALLSSSVVNIEVPEDGARSYIRLEVPNTRHLELAVTLEPMDDLQDEVRLVWHRHDLGGVDVDFYPQGSALLDLHETDADLYFSAY